jgi:hypothetical protein
MTTMRVTSSAGKASVCPPALARWAPAGTIASQVSTGNSEGLESARELRVGRSGSAAGTARTFIASDSPSRLNDGHDASVVMTRAMAVPPSPSNT